MGKRTVKWLFPWACALAVGVLSYLLGFQEGVSDSMTTDTVRQRVEPETINPGAERLYRVKVGGRWGYIDRRGALVIEPIYQEALRFSCDRAGVKVHDKWGFIDVHGSPVIPTRYKWVVAFSENRAAVTLDGKEWQMVDRGGQRVGNLSFADCFFFREGLAEVRIVGEDGSCYVDLSGKRAFESVFPHAISFTEGLGSVSVGPVGRARVNRFGDIVAGPGQKWWLGGTGCGLTEFRGDTGLRGLLDRNGKTYMEPFADEIMSRPEEGMLVYKKDGRWGWCDVVRKAKGPAEFEKLSRYNGGVAVGILDGDAVFIDSWGTVLVRIPGNVSDVAGFHRGAELAPVTMRSGEVLYVDRDGQVVWPPLRRGDYRVDSLRKQYVTPR